MRTIGWMGMVGAALLSCGAQAQEVVHWEAPAAQTGRFSYFPMGTELKLTTRAELTTKESHLGDRFYLDVAEPLVYHGQTVVPAGAIAVGEVASLERSGHLGKKGEIGIRLLYVQTPSGPIRLSGHASGVGKGQEVLAIGGGVLIWWPMMFIHGSSGRLPAESNVTAYLADNLRFAVTADAKGASLAMPEGAGDGTATPVARQGKPALLAGR